MMTNKEAFTLGFLGRMAERGVTPSQFEKCAGGVLGEGIEAGGHAFSALTPMALAALIGIPAATGILTGWGHAGMEDVSEEDIERMKIGDRADTYRSEARRIRRKLGRDKWRKQSPAEKF